MSSKFRRFSTRLKAKASNKFVQYEDSQIKGSKYYSMKGLSPSKYFSNPLNFNLMEAKDKKILHIRFGLALLNILKERKEIADANKLSGIKDHKLVSSLRKLSAASGIDFGTVQKISKGDQGFEFFTFVDLIEALDLDMISFGQYFNSITDQEIKKYQLLIQKSRLQNTLSKKPKKK